MRFCISLLLLLYTVLVFVIASVVDDEFFNSCRAGDIDKVVKYLENGTPVNSRDAKGNSGLVIAAGRGKSEIVKLLLNNGADPNDYTAAGLFEYKTALQWACSQGRTETAAVLINAGADPHNPPERGVFGGKTALMWASSQGRKDVVRLLLSVGVNPDFSSSSGNFKVW